MKMAWLYCFLNRKTFEDMSKLCKFARVRGWTGKPTASPMVIGLARTCRGKPDPLGERPNFIFLNRLVIPD